MECRDPSGPSANHAPPGTKRVSTGGSTGGRSARDEATRSSSQKTMNGWRSGSSGPIRSVK